MNKLNHLFFLLLAVMLLASCGKTPKEPQLIVSADTLIFKGNETLSLYVTTNNSEQREFYVNSPYDWILVSPQSGRIDCSVQSSLRHLMQVHEYSRVPLVEVDALWKQHRCVAVGVKGQDAVVQLVGLTVGLCLLHQPLEQGVAVLKTLRMPLHTHHRLVLRTLHGLDDTVCGTGCHTELRPGVTDSLVVERVDKD